MEGSSSLPLLAKPFGCLQAGFLWIVIADSAAILFLNHIPPLPIPHGLEYPLGSRKHLGVEPYLRTSNYDSCHWQQHIYSKMIKPKVTCNSSVPYAMGNPYRAKGNNSGFVTMHILTKIYTAVHLRCRPHYKWAEIQSSTS